MESLNRIFGVLLAPTATFKKIAEKPTWALALVVLLLLGAVVGFLAVQRIDADAQRDLIRDQIEERSGLRGDELESRVDQIVGVNQKVAPFTPIIGTAFGIIAYVLMAGFFLLGARLADGEIDFRRSLATTVHGMVPQGVGALVAIPIVLSQSSLDPQAVQQGRLLASNLGFLAPEGASSVVTVLLSSLDLFTFWSIALLVIGFSVVARLSKGAAAAIVIVGWLIWIGAKVGLAAAFG